MTTTAKDWRTLPAGRELDALVAERLFGHEVRARRHYDLGWTTTHEYFGELGGRPEWRFLPLYSTKIGAAWEIVEKLRADGCRLLLAETETDTGNVWEAQFARGPRGASTYRYAYEATVPLAIVRAALAATEAR